MGRDRASTNSWGRRGSVLAIGFAALALTIGGFLSAAGADEVTDPGTVPTSAVTTPPTDPPADDPGSSNEPTDAPADDGPEATTTTTISADDGPSAQKSSPPPAAPTETTSALDVDAAGPLNIPLNNATAEVGTDCPADGQTYWHFVTSPNNNHSVFVTFHLNLGDGIHDISTWVPNGSQNDNVFVLVPGGYTLTSLVKTGSNADANWDGEKKPATKFQLSHLCPGTQSIGDLVVTKVVSGTPGQDEGFPFTVEVDCTLNDSPVTVPDSPFTFTAAGDSPHTFSGIAAGALCTVEETDNGGADQVLITYQGGAGNVTIVQGGQVSATVTNVFNEEGTGSLQITKTVLGDPAGTDGYPFTVHVECTDDPNDPYNLTFNVQAPGPQTITGIPDKSICTITETDDGGAVDVDISSDQVEIVESTTAQVTVTNTFTTLEVAKIVENPPAVDTEFTVHVTCVEGDNPPSIDEDVVFTSSADGTVTPALQTFTGIPLDSTCTVEEIDPPASVTPIYDPAGAPDPGVTVDANALRVGVSVTNSFPSSGVVGSVSVTKAIGEGAAPPPESEFLVHVECTDGTGTDLTFTPDELGPKSVPVNIPEGSGTTCTVRETNVGANVKVSYSPPDADDPGFLLTVGAPTQPVTITNSFVEVDPAVVSSSAGDSAVLSSTTGVLPFTGSATEVLLKTAAWLLVLGGVAVLVARRVRRRRLIA